MHSAKSIAGLYAEIQQLKTKLKEAMFKNYNLKLATNIMPMAVVPPQLIELVYKVGRRIIETSAVGGKLLYKSFELQMRMHFTELDFESSDIQKLMQDVYDDYFNKVEAEKENQKVKGLYESIDPNYKPEGVEFVDLISQKENNKTETLTKVIPKEGGTAGHFIRSYDTKDNVLILDEAFRFDSPKWIKDVKIPLVKDKGIPLQMYVTLRQMKLMGIPDKSLAKAKLSTVQNAETMLFLNKIMKENNFKEISEAGNRILDSPSTNYATSTMIQAGYEITNTNVMTNDFTRKITTKQAKEIYGVSEMTKELLNKYNLNWDSEIFIHFDVYLNLKPSEK